MNMIQNESKLLIIIAHIAKLHASIAWSDPETLETACWQARSSGEVPPATRLKGMEPEGCRASNHPSLS